MSVCHSLSCLTFANFTYSVHCVSMRRGHPGGLQRLGPGHCVWLMGTVGPRHYLWVGVRGHSHRRRSPKWVAPTHTHTLIDCASAAPSSTPTYSFPKMQSDSPVAACDISRTMLRTSSRKAGPLHQATTCAIFTCLVHGGAVGKAPTNPCAKVMAKSGDASWGLERSSRVVTQAVSGS